jgi:hypothetical protein
MAASEDELAKKQVQEAVWAWSGRIIVLAVTFGFGFFAAWVLWGAGVTGAPAMRQRAEAQDAQILELKNKRVDIEGQLTVVRGRLEQCERSLAQARAAGAAPPPNP